MKKLRQADSNMNFLHLRVVTNIVTLLNKMRTTQHEIEKIQKSPIHSHHHIFITCSDGTKFRIYIQFKQESINNYIINDIATDFYNTFNLLLHNNHDIQKLNVTII